MRTLQKHSRKRLLVNHLNNIGIVSSNNITTVNCVLKVILATTIKNEAAQMCPRLFRIEFMGATKIIE